MKFTNSEISAQHLPVVLLSTLPPRVGIDCRKVPLLTLALIFPDTCGSKEAEVLLADEDLVLPSASQRTEPKWFRQLLDQTLCERPTQMSWARADTLKRVVASLEEAGCDRVRREPANRGVADRASHRVDVNLKRLFTDL